MQDSSDFRFLVAAAAALIFPSPKFCVTVSAFPKPSYFWGTAMEYWMWFVLGFALLMLEMATPGGFYFIFFGASAFVVALLDLFGITGSAWMEWMLFSIFAAGATTLFRQRMLERFGAPMPSGEVDSLVGEIAV